MEDSRDFSDNGSSRDSEDDSIVEGAIAHGGGDRVATSLEGDVADTGTSPSRGRQSLQRTMVSHVVRHSLMHRAPTIQMEKRRKMVHATDSGDAGGPSMLAGLVSPLPPPTSLGNAPTMAIVMPTAVRRNPLRPHSLSDAFMAVYHGRPIRRGTLVVPPPPFRPATTSALAVVQAASTNAPLVVDILSTSVAASIATPVTSPLDARVSVPVGGVVLEGIPPPSFSFQLGTGVDSMSPIGSGSPWPEGFTLESDGFFLDIATQVRYQQVISSGGTLRFEEVSFVEAERILSEKEIEAQTSAIVDRIVERCLDPLVEGTDPSIRGSHVDVEEDIDPSIPETQPDVHGSRHVS